jgi:hypothetical protein
MKEFNIEFEKDGKITRAIHVRENRIQYEIQWYVVKRGYNLVRIVEVAPMGDVTQGGMFGCD